MKETGLICTGESIRGILEGRKRMTRRVIKPQPEQLNEKLFGFPVGQYSKTVNLKDNLWAYRTERWRANKNSAFRQVTSKPFKCPYGKVGDRLWVREAFWRVRLQGGGHYYETPSYSGGPLPSSGYTDATYWNATPEDLGEDMTLNDIRCFEKPEIEDCSWNWPDGAWWIKKPSIFMPKWAARIWRENTSIGVEQMKGKYYLYADEILESGIITTRKIIDPWVWVLEFKRLIS